MKRLFLAIYIACLFTAFAPLARATAGKCCATLFGSGLPPQTCCAEADTTSGSSCAANQTEVDCGTYTVCPQSSNASTLCAASDATPGTPSAVPTTPAEFPIIVPKLSINIPTLSMPDFARVTQGVDDNGRAYLFIPFISVYLAAAYKLGVGVAAVLAVIIIMVGGFIWIAAAGDSGKIGQAKSMISNAIIGLILALGSYVALQSSTPTWST